MAQSGIHPFLGKWDINGGTPEHPRSMWLGVSENNGKIAIEFQPSGGNVYPVHEFKVDGSHLKITLNATTTLDIQPDGTALNIVEKHGEQTASMKCEAAPALDRPAPKTWSTPEALFNGDSAFRGLSSATAEKSDFRFLRFRPPPLRGPDTDDLALPHIRLDRALQFLIGDRLQ